MAHVIECTDPFRLGHDARRFTAPGGTTIRQLLEKHEPGFVEFQHPTYCVVNGRAKMRREWDTYVVQEDDVVCFIRMAGLPAVAAWVWVAIAVVSVAAAVYVYNSIPKPGSQANNTPEADPVFDLKGQYNQVRLGNPIEVPYGRNRLWPSIAAREYNKYVNNDQYRYSLYCLGQGSYDIEAVQIEDTAIANFQDVTYEVYGPGQQVTLFPVNVVTSVEVGTTELLGPNEGGYAGPSGPFNANPAGTQTNHLEVDVVLPGGLYLAANDGTLGDLTVTALFECRLIDGAGTPIGPWVTLANMSKTLRTNTPQRFTLELDVPPGRYQVRAQRTNDKDTQAKASNTLQWAALRAFLPSTKNYGNVTMVAVKAKATNNLNDSAARRFNVIGTRKLRTWDPTTRTWSGEVATRSLVAAFCDAFQADYGGQLGDGYLNLRELWVFDAVLQGAGTHFDFVFDQRSTVWETARVIARVARAVPMLNGSQVTMIRDVPKTLPTAVFNQECIVEGSFSWDMKLAGVDEFDGVEVTYTDQSTWKEETVRVLVGDDAGDNLEQVRIPGCCDRTRAFREGYYYRAGKKYVREQFTFRTGLEGYLPAYGDLVGVSHDLPRWAQGGMVLSLSADRLTLGLSEGVTVAAGHVIGLRAKDGTLGGPYAVSAGADSRHVVLSAPLPDLFYFDGSHESPMFLLGPSSEWSKLCVVTGLRPGDDDTVEVQSVPYDSRLFDGDALVPDPLDGAAVPESPDDLPAVSGLTVALVPNVPQAALVSWQASLGAKSYVVQVSYDNANWETAATPDVNHAQVSVLAGHLYVRVAAVNVGAGAWAYWDDALVPLEPTDPYADATVGGTEYQQLLRPDLFP